MKYISAKSQRFNISTDNCETGCTASDRLTVYYDGSCPLCSAEVGFYSSRGGGEKLRLVDVSDHRADLGTNLSSDAAMKRFHVRRSDGNLISGAAAFVAVWDVLPDWKWLAGVARLPGILLLFELSYRIFLRFQPLISTALRKLLS